MQHGQKYLKDQIYKNTYIYIYIYIYKLNKLEYTQASLIYSLYINYFFE